MATIAHKINSRIPIPKVNSSLKPPKGRSSNEKNRTAIPIRVAIIVVAMLRFCLVGDFIISIKYHKKRYL